jgi:hypothetical protein
MKKVYTILATALLATLFSGQVMGQANFTSRTSGSWAASGSWNLSSGSDADGIPDSDDNVTIADGHTITVSANANCNNLTLNGASSGTNNTTVTLSGSVTLTANGAISLINPTNGSGAYNAFTQINVGSGALSAATISMSSASGKNNVRINTGSGGSIQVTEGLSIGATNNIFDISNGTLLIGSQTGSWTGTVLVNSASNFEFNATSGNQSIPGATFPNLTISGGSVKTAQGPITVTGMLTMNNGILTTTTSNLLTLAASANAVSGGSNTSFINGPVRKLGLPKNSSYTFPIGSNDAGGIRLASIYNTSNGSGDYTIELLRADPQSLGTTGVGTAAGPTALTRREYWDITSTKSFELTLDWNSRSSINSPVGLTIATFNSGSWTVEGTGSNRPASVSGTQLTKNSLTAGTNLKYAIASLQAGAAFPLPVTFGTIKAFEKGTGVQVDWTSYSELNIANYQVERSADGINFTSIGEVAPRNVTDATNYNFFDAMPLSGTSFYRIRNNDIDGKSGLSTIVKVNLNKNIKTISVYPNPVRGNRVSFQTSDLAKGLYNVEVYNTMGSRVFSQALNHAGGAITQTLSLPTLQSGSYTLRINGTSSSSIHKITILQ